MLDAGVNPGEFRQVVQGPVPVIGHQLFQVGFHGHDVHQVTVLIQGPALQLNFHLVMMGVEVIFRPPIAADEIMPGHEISFHRQGVPVHALLLK